MLNKNREERKIKINELSDRSENTEDLNFKKQNYPCKVIEVQINYLIYRLDNTRTLDNQEEYIRKNDLPNDFFDLDRQENLEVQEVQDKLIKETLKKKNSSLEASFEQKGGQTESLVITPEGVMINGNRRLCLMRSENYDVVKCKVIDDPNLINRETEIEAWLDIAETGKVEYSWTGQGIAIEKLLEKGMSYEEIREFKGMVSAKEVRLLADAVKNARESLEMRGVPGEWSKVVKSEEIYRQAAAKKLDDVDRRAVDLNVIAIDSATTDVVDGRAYDVVMGLLRYPKAGTKVMNKWAQGSDTTYEDNLTGEEVNPAGFNEDSFKNNILKDQDKIDEMVLDLKDFIEEEKDEASGRGERRRLITEVDKAFKALEKAKYLSTNSSHDRNGVDLKLSTMSTNIEEILTNIRDLDNNS
ncbi:hypothetical protein N9C43_04915 [Gammaproteobacteria bacterium]|nr:hypothetical protein [Gammaproteobacteria bacterium]